MQRKPLEERWDKRSLKLISGVPWRKSESDEKVDGEKMKLREMTDEEKKERDQRIRWREEVQQPHRFSIRLQDIQEHGQTSGCQGCKSVLRGTTRQSHKPECRTRFETLMKEDARVKASNKREME